MKTLTWEDLEKAAGSTVQEQTYMINSATALYCGTISLGGNKYALKPLRYGLVKPRYPSNPHALK